MLSFYDGTTKLNSTTKSNIHPDSQMYMMIFWI